jgi:hypothetical protein
MTTEPKPASQGISMTVGSNSGAIAAVNAGRDATVAQSVGATAEESLSQEEAGALLAEVLKLIQAADLPESEKEEAEMYAKLAKKEAEKKEPDKKRIIGNLEGATGLLKRLGDTAEASKKLVDQLKGPVTKLAIWLGLQAVHFFG